MASEIQSRQQGMETLSLSTIFYKDTTRIVGMGISVIVVILNIAEIVIIARKKKNKKNNFERTLLSLSVTDLFYGALNLALLTSQLTIMNIQHGDMIVSYTIHLFVVVSSMLHVLLIATDRLFAVVAPLKHRVVATPKQMSYLIGGVWFLSAVASIAFTAYISIYIKLTPRIPPEKFNSSQIQPTPYFKMMYGNKKPTHGNPILGNGQSNSTNRKTNSKLGERTSTHGQTNSTHKPIFYRKSTYGYLNLTQGQPTQKKMSRKSPTLNPQKFYKRRNKQNLTHGQAALSNETQPKPDEGESKIISSHRRKQNGKKRAKNGHNDRMILKQMITSVCIVNCRCVVGHYLYDHHLQSTSFTTSKYEGKGFFGQSAGSRLLYGFHPVLHRGRLVPQEKS